MKLKKHSQVIKTTPPATTFVDTTPPSKSENNEINPKTSDPTTSLKELLKLNEQNNDVPLVAFTEQKSARVHDEWQP